MSGDMLRELINRLLEAAEREGTFTEEVALSVERQFRREFKGAEIYVGERPARTPEAKKKAVVEAYLQDKPIPEIIKENGISRAALYRYLKK